MRHHLLRLQRYLYEWPLLIRHGTRFSDITMSENEEGHTNQQPYRSNHQEQQALYNRPLVRTEDSAASLLEYSQSSEEAYSHKRDGSTNTGLQASTVSGSTSFRFREDISGSSRVVRFASSSYPEGNPSVVNSQYQQNQQRKIQSVDEGAPLVYTDNQTSSSAKQRRHRHHHRQRGGGATVNRETFLDTPNRWVTQLAYSFRTPPAPKTKKQPMTTEPTGESPHTADICKNTAIKGNPSGKHKLAVNNNPTQRHSSSFHSHGSESSPLLQLKEEQGINYNSFPLHYLGHNVQHSHRKLFASNRVHRHPYDYISVAVAFLKDYEAARPPTLASNVTVITPWHMGLYRVKYSTAYSFLLSSATLALFLSSALEGPSATNSNIRLHTISCLNLFALLIFGTDMWITRQFQKVNHNAKVKPSSNAGSKQMMGLPPVVIRARTSEANLLMRPLCLFGLFLALENVGWLLARPERTFVVLYSSIWKPIVLYYISAQARHAMEALLRIARTVTRVLIIEMVLILSFAAVACRLFTDFESFDHLSVAWLSLFKRTWE
jgi:hypothetical protein